jgi:integrase
MKTRRGCLLKRGQGWLCQTVNNDGKRTSQLMRKPDGTPCKTKAEAKVARVEFMRLFTAKDTRDSLAVIASRIETVKADIAEREETRNPPLTIANAWLAFKSSPRKPDCGERTLTGYENHFARFVQWIAKERPSIVAMRDVTPAIAADYAKNLAGAKVTASTFNQHIGLLRLAWKVLKDEAKTGGVNPWGNTPKDGIARRKGQALANRKRPLTTTQFDAIMAAASSDPDLKDLLTVLAWTGQRLVDVVKLRWETINFPDKVITLYPQKTARRTGKAVHIPIFPALLDVLNRRHAAMPHTTAEAYVFPEMIKEYSGIVAHPRKGLRRRNQSAQPAVGATLAKRIQDVFTKAGIKTTEERTGLKREVVLYGAHSFRHLFVTSAAAAGLPSAVIKSITGHTSDAMSEHYQQFDAKLASDFAKQLTGKTPAALPAGREPMPPWIREGLATMTPENWQAVRDELMTNRERLLITPK